MLFYVLFISIIEHTEDDICVPSLSANHPKIYLILSTLGYQKPVNLATWTVRPFLALKNCTIQSYSVSGTSISNTQL